MDTNYNPPKNSILLTGKRIKHHKTFRDRYIGNNNQKDTRKKRPHNAVDQKDTSQNGAKRYI